MVSFRIIVTSALVLTVPVVAQLTQEQLAGNITTLGNNTTALELTARNIKPVNGIGAILGTGSLGIVVNGIKLLTKILLALSPELGSEGPVLKPSAKAIEVYKEFFIVCSVHQHNP
jgi:hypothetical protein